MYIVKKLPIFRTKHTSVWMYFNLAAIRKIIERLSLTTLDFVFTHRNRFIRFRVVSIDKHAAERIYCVSLIFCTIIVWIEAIHV